jgi:hypothetical protein
VWFEFFCFKFRFVTVFLIAEQIRKGMMTTSKDIEGILLVDEMTSADVKHIRTVEQPKETPVDSDSGKSMDIVDLFCNEENC